MKKIILLYFYLVIIFFAFGCSINNFKTLNIENEKIYYNDKIYIPYDLNGASLFFNDNVNKNKIAEIWNFYHTKKGNVYIATNDINKDFLYIDCLPIKLWVNIEFTLFDIFDLKINKITAWNNKVPFSNENVVEIWTSNSDNINLGDIIILNNSFQNIEGELLYGINCYLSEFDYLYIGGISIIEKENIFYFEINDNENLPDYYQIKNEYVELFKRNIY